MSSEQKEEQKFDIINKARHYNSHPSGVECIELAERLPFNTGNAFKYVFRCGDKGNPRQDLEKALYYVKREAQHLKNLIRWRTTAEVEKMWVDEHFTATDLGNLEKIVRAEHDFWTRSVYQRLFRHNVRITAYIKELELAVGDIEVLIRRLDDPTYGDPKPALNSVTTIHTDWQKGGLPQN